VVRVSALAASCLIILVSLFLATPYLGRAGPDVTRGGALASVSLQVLDFSITATDLSPGTLPPGASATSSITLQSSGGFTGSVSLSASSGPSRGFSFKFDTDQVQLSLGGSAVATLTVTTSSSISPGSYTITVTGTCSSGLCTVPPQSHSITLGITVSGDFSIAASPSALDMPVGSSQSSTITLTSLDGFAGTINISTSASSSNLSVTCDRPSASLVSGAAATLTCKFTTFAIGSYSGTVTGTYGSLSHTVSIQVVSNTQPGFTISASPQSFIVQAGFSNYTTLTLTSVNGFSGDVSLSSTSGSGSFSPASIRLSAGGVANSNFTVTGNTAGVVQITVTAYSQFITHTTTLSVYIWDFRLVGPSSIKTQAGVSGTGDLAIISLGGFYGTVSLSLTFPQGVSASLIHDQVNLVANQQLSDGLWVNSSLARTFSVIVIANSRQLSHSTVVAVTVADFAVDASPSLVTVFAGQSTSSTVTLSSLNGFCCSVNLSALASTSGLATSFSVNPVEVPQDGTGNSNLTITIGSAVPGGSYQVKVSAVGGGGPPHVAIVYLTVVTDFAISMSPARIDVSLGVSATGQVTVIGSRGFSGSLILSATCSGSGVDLTLSQQTVELSQGQPVAVTLTISTNSFAVPGSYSITVIGSSSSMSHNSSITLVLTPGPRISAPSYLTVQAGSPVVFKVNATDADSSRLITLFAASSTIPLGAVFTTASGVGIVTGIFNWIPSSPRDVGAHNITFTVTDGHGGRVSAFVVVTVNPVNRTNAWMGVLPYVMLAGAGVGLAVIGGWVWRKRVWTAVRISTLQA